MIDKFDDDKIQKHKVWVQTDGVDGTRICIENSVVETDLKDMYLVDSKLLNVEIRNCKIINVDFSRSDLRGAIFENVEIHKGIFSGTYLTNCKFLNCKFFDCGLGGANLKKTKFECTGFDGCELSSTNLDLAVFDNCIVKNTVFLNIQNIETCNWINSKLLNVTSNELTFDKIREINSEIDIIGSTSIMSNDKQRILVEFCFPNEIRVPCEQYLVYFSQFMVDQYVDVNTTLLRDDLKSTFEIKPKNKNIALKAIYELLTQYLNLPSIELTEINHDKDIKQARLMSELYSLKSKLSLAYAENNSLRKSALNGDLIQYVDVVSDSKGKISDKEFMIGEYLKVKPIKLLGLEINVPLMLNRIKDKY
ncbi:hypothetical protein PULV_a1061 [Pseudoalteromonas ulvae UL12]|uniref:pentapeptide repeat-containing protein n=1 Tax=Pseudoalteromonas ulvae TaxID=107327 RepID=UPI00186B7F1B|nr:pentapeptide repeat-containing protein [Pseudoalteromonas ulvae]MBE0363596.1 hypothetical protein [Pseudoalteromonas ulvae UL12]